MSQPPTRLNRPGVDNSPIHYSHVPLNDFQLFFFVNMHHAPMYVKIMFRQTVNSWSRYCFTHLHRIRVMKTEELVNYCL